MFLDNLVVNLSIVLPMIAAVSCHYGRNTYKPGYTFWDEDFCRDCTCTLNGSVICEDKTCSKCLEASVSLESFSTYLYMCVICHLHNDLWVESKEN